MLGRDVLQHWGWGIQILREQMLILTEQNEKEITPIVWATKGNRGRLQVTPIKITLKNTEPIRQKQYEISLEGRRGLKPVIEELIQDGLLEPAMSPYNSPILAV